MEMENLSWQRTRDRTKGWVCDNGRVPAEGMWGPGFSPSTQWEPEFMHFYSIFVLGSLLDFPFTSSHILSRESIDCPGGACGSQCVFSTMFSHRAGSNG